MKKTILLTGASGFIGKNVIESLSGKYQFLTPSHKELELLDTQAVDKYFKKHKIDIVVHLANRGGSQKEAVIDPLSPNLRLFFNLAKNQRYFKKMIVVGSGSEYGKQYPIKSVKEEEFNIRVPGDEFGFYKYVVGNYIEQSKNIINLRVFGIFGKYEDWRFRFISNSICKALYKMPIVINNNSYFDYLYINDFVSILDYFISYHAKFKTYNTGRGKRIKLDMIAKKISLLTGSNVPIRVKNKQLGLEYTCNNQRLRSEINNLQFTPIDLALNELIGHFQNNLSTIDKKSLNLKRVDIWKNHTI